MNTAELAAHHRELFARDAIMATSPRGVFAEGALAIDGRELVDVVARGDDLFYDFGDVLLHVRLGPRGRFFERAAEEPGAPHARLRLEGSRAIVELVGATVCRLVQGVAHADLR